MARITTGTSIVANIAGGALNNTVQGREITSSSVATDAAVGVGGVVLGKVAGAVIDKLSPAIKGTIGEVSTKIKYLTKGYVSEGKAVVPTGGTTPTGRVQRAVYDHKINNFVTGGKLTVESKFNTATQTASQRAAAANVTTPGAYNR